MGQDAALGGDGVGLDDLLQQPQQLADDRRAVGGRIDPDHRVARAQQQAVDDRGGDASEVVGGVVGLQAGGEAAGEAQRAAETCGHLGFGADQDEILVAHDLADRGGHLRGEAGREGRKGGRVGGVGQQEVAEIPDGQGGNGGENRGLVGVADEPRDIVGVVVDDGFGQEPLQGRVGQGHPGGDALLKRTGGQTGQGVARAQGGRLGHQGLQVGEGPAMGRHAASDPGPG